MKPPFPTRGVAARRAAHAAAVLVLGCAAGCAAYSAPDAGAGPAVAAGPAVVADMRTYRIDVRSGETFELRLPTAAGTGYRWQLVDPVPAPVRAAGVSRVEPPLGDLVGASGQEVWAFQAAEAGRGQLAFVYRRPFDAASVPPAQRAVFRIQVR
ncbi:MAG: protease inhibitor I42 family protein [Burkholderiales bacterium]|jgi:predicted secreted protein